MQCIQRGNVIYRLLRNEYEHLLLDTILINFMCKNLFKKLPKAGNEQIDAILFPLILRVVILWNQLLLLMLIFLEFELLYQFISRFLAIAFSSKIKLQGADAVFICFPLNSAFFIINDMHSVSYKSGISNSVLLV